jgi:hypothetical protein
MQNTSGFYFNCETSLEVEGVGVVEEVVVVVVVVVTIMMHDLFELRMQNAKL